MPIDQRHAAMMATRQECFWTNATEIHDFHVQSYATLTDRSGENWRFVNWNSGSTLKKREQQIAEYTAAMFCISPGIPASYMGIFPRRTLHLVEMP